MNLTTVAVKARERNGTIEFDAAVTREVGASTHEARNHRRKCVQDLLAGAARRNGFARFPNGQRVLPTIDAASFEYRIKFGAVLGPVLVERIPGLACHSTADTRATHVFENILRRPERFIRHAHDGFRCRDLFGPKWIAMCMGGVGELWRGIADMAA